MASATTVREQVRKRTIHPASFEPRGLGRAVMVSKKEISGWPIYFTSPRRNHNNDNIVIFLHGGGFVNEIVRAHWRFVRYITVTTGVECVVPIYPLAPAATADAVVPATGRLLHTIISSAGAKKVTVIGNSAGAALGLCAAQWLRDAKLSQPDHLILISPGGDYSISRPEQVAIAARDPVNDIPGARETGRLYAGSLDIKHPWVSPLNGDFSGLAPMTIFSGTLDLFYPDCIDLATKARNAGTAVDLHLREGQPHNYAAMPTPEGREAREIILGAISARRRCDERTGLKNR